MKEYSFYLVHVNLCLSLKSKLSYAMKTHSMENVHGLIKTASLKCPSHVSLVSPHLNFQLYLIQPGEKRRHFTISSNLKAVAWPKLETPVSVVYFKLLGMTSNASF